MSMRLLVRSIAAAIVAIGASAVQAGVIHYTATHQSGDRWRYDYAMTTLPGESAPAELTVWFPRALHADLEMLDAPAGWDGLVVQPDPLLPADGYADLLDTGSGADDGSTTMRWSVGFTWLGTGTPGAQPFDVVDPVSFRVLSSGFTAALDGPGDGSVPVPSTLLLVGGLLWALRAGRGGSARAVEVAHG